MNQRHIPHEKPIITAKVFFPNIIKNNLCTKRETLSVISINLKSLYPRKLKVRRFRDRRSFVNVDILVPMHSDRFGQY